ncbi:hypothetical protein WMF38_40370 [Sorangium sp. So ce118]
MPRVRHRLARRLALAAALLFIAPVFIAPVVVAHGRVWLDGPILRGQVWWRHDEHVHIDSR